MLDIQLLRSDLAAVAARLQQRGYILDRDKFEQVEAERKAIQTKTQGLQARRNALSREVGAAKGRGEEAAEAMLEVRKVGAAVGGLEFETSAKLSGSRFYTLRGAVARLHRALAQFMLDLHTTEHGY